MNDHLETHKLTGKFKLSSGGESDIYLDLRSALFCWECQEDIKNWYLDELESSWVIGTGTFGAILLGFLSQSGIEALLWNPKNHGVEWSGKLPPIGAKVCIVDDVKTTGNTLRNLKEACEKQGWIVVQELVYLDRTN